MALEVYLSGTEVVLTIDLADSAGNPLSVNAVDYRVVNQDGLDVVARQALSGFIAGDTSVTITVPANLNAVATGNTREIRTVNLYCDQDAGTVLLTKSYAVEVTDPLTVGVNSFQSFPQAQLTALDIPNIDAFSNASDQMKIQALIEAREHLVQLNFNLLNSNANFGQDQLAYVPEGEFQSSYVARNSLFIFNGDLDVLNPTQYAELPDRFKRALRQAQVVEANAILGGEQMDAMRTAGIIEDAVGESRQKFRDRGVALRLPVCRRALGYLGAYVSFSKRIGRSG